MKRHARGGDDSGQVLLLSLAFGLITILLVMVVVSASSIHLERKRLLALADVLAAEAASAVDAGALYGGTATPPDAGGPVPLTSSSVRARVEQHLQDEPQAAARFVDLDLVDARTPDGRTAEVHLAAVARPPLVPWVIAPWSDGITIEATARARAW